MSIQLPKRFGKYILQEKIATGGMAELYKAKITGFGGFEKLIAIKKILPHLLAERELVISFVEEAKLAALLHHENIMQVYDFGQMEGSYFIAMEYLDGRDLRAVSNTAIAQKTPLSIPLCCYIVSSVCSGLDYAHNLKDSDGAPLNIVHRDISPHNIFITYEGQIKIVDFGIATVAGKDSTTQKGTIKGKVSYMSPEQAEGKKLDLRSDLFSVGILLYELITRERMFPGDPFGVLARVRRAEFVPPETVCPDLPESLVRILKSSLARDPDQRYQTCDELRTDLESFITMGNHRLDGKSVRRYLKSLFPDASSRYPTEDHEPTIFDSGDRSASGESDTETSQPSKKPVVVTSEEPTEEIVKHRFTISGTVMLMVCLVTLFFVSHSTNPAEKKMAEAFRALKGGFNRKAAVHFGYAVDQDPSMRNNIAKPWAFALRKQALLLENSDPEGAMRLLEKSIGLDDSKALTYLDIGRLYDQVDDYANAARFYREAARLTPDSAETWFRLGRAYSVINQHGKAIIAFQHAEYLNPPFLDDVLFNLAVSLDESGFSKKSIRKLEKAIALNPDNEYAVKYLESLMR